MSTSPLPARCWTPVDGNLALGSWSLASYALTPWALFILVLASVGDTSTRGLSGVYTGRGQGDPRERFGNRFAIITDTATAYTKSNMGAQKVGVGLGVEGNVYEPGYYCMEGKGKGGLVSAAFSCPVCTW